MARDYYRNYLMILADGSGSMGPQFEGDGTKPIDELSDALHSFLTSDILGIEPLAKRGEIAVGLFRNRGKEIVDWQQLAAAESSGHPFYKISDGVSLPPLDAQGQTPLVDACLRGIDTLTERRKSMAQFAPEFKPVVVLITDGAPSPGQDVERLSRVVQERAYRTGVTGADFLFLAFGTRQANMDILSRIAPQSTWDLRSKTIRECIRLVSESVRRSMRDHGNQERGSYRPGQHPDYASIYHHLGDPFQSMRA